MSGWVVNTGIGIGAPTVIANTMLVAEVTRARGGVGGDECVDAGQPGDLTAAETGHSGRCGDRRGAGARGGVATENSRAAMPRVTVSVEVVTVLPPPSIVTTGWVPHATPFWPPPGCVLKANSSPDCRAGRRAGLPLPRPPRWRRYPARPPPGPLPREPVGTSSATARAVRGYEHRYHPGESGFPASPPGLDPLGQFSQSTDLAAPGLPRATTDPESSFIVDLPRLPRRLPTEPPVAPWPWPASRRRCPPPPASGGPPRPRRTPAGSARPPPPAGDAATPSLPPTPRYATPGGQLLSAQRFSRICDQRNSRLSGVLLLLLS